MFVAIASSGGIGGNLTAVWDSGGTNQQMQVLAFQNGGINGVSVLMLGNPTPGNKTLALSWSTLRSVSVQAASFSGVNLAIMAGGVVNAANSTTGPATVTVQQSAADVVLSFFTLNSAPTATITAVSGNQIAIDNQYGGSQNCLAGSWTAGTTAYTAAPTATLSASASWIAVSLCVFAAQVSVAGGTVTSDAIGTVLQFAGLTSENYTGITVTSAANALVATLVTASTVTSATATWDSGGTNQAMDLVGSNGSKVFIFALMNPTAGNKTLAMTWSGSSGGSGGVGCAIEATSWIGARNDGGSATFAHFNAASIGSGGTTVLGIAGETNSVSLGVVISGQNVSDINYTQIYLVNHTASSYLLGDANANNTNFAWSLASAASSVAAGLVIAGAGPNPGAWPDRITISIAFSAAFAAKLGALVGASLRAALPPPDRVAEMFNWMLDEAPACVGIEDHSVFPS